MDKQQVSKIRVWGWLHPLRILLRLPLLLWHTFFGLALLRLAQSRAFSNLRLRDRSLEMAVQIWWTDTFCRIFGIRRLVRGRIGAQTSFVVANHISFLDIILLGSIARLSFVSKAEIARWPLVGTIARMGDTIFHQRGSGSSLEAAVQAISEKIRQGRNVAIFPEGRIYCGDRVHRFHARLFRVPIETNVPVVPVCIRYTRGGRLNPRICLCDREERFFWNLLRLLGEPGSVAEVIVLPPVYPQGENRRELARAAEVAIAEVYPDAP